MRQKLQDLEKEKQKISSENARLHEELQAMQQQLARQVDIRMFSCSCTPSMYCSFCYCYYMRMRMLYTHHTHTPNMSTYACIHVYVIKRRLCQNMQKQVPFSHSYAYIHAHTHTGPCARLPSRSARRRGQNVQKQIGSGSL